MEAFEFALDASVIRRPLPSDAGARVRRRRMRPHGGGRTDTPSQLSTRRALEVKLCLAALGLGWVEGGCAAVSIWQRGAVIDEPGRQPRRGPIDGRGLDNRDDPMRRVAVGIEPDRARGAIQA